MHGPPLPFGPVGGRGNASMAAHAAERQDRVSSEPRKETFSSPVCFSLIRPFLSSRWFGDGGYFSYIIRTALGFLATSTKEEQNCFKGRDAGAQQAAPELSCPCCRARPSPVSSGRERTSTQRFGQRGAEYCCVALGWQPALRQPNA